MKKNWSLLIVAIVVLVIGVVFYGILNGAPKDEANTDGTSNSSEEWVGYTNTFPAYEYNGVMEADNEDQHFLLEDKPQNKPEELVALNFYYEITGEYDKLYDLCGSESLQISAVNTEKNFNEGMYIQEYIVRHLTTLSMDEFVHRSTVILEMIKTNVEQNKLTEYTMVQGDFAMKSPSAQESLSELSDGGHTFYFLCGKNQNDEWKLFELYWE